MADPRPTDPRGAAQRIGDFLAAFHRAPFRAPCSPPETRIIAHIVDPTSPTGYRQLTSDDLITLLGAFGVVVMHETDPR
jgi:hypothetical protein